MFNVQEGDESEFEFRRSIYQSTYFVRSFSTQIFCHSTSRPLHKVFAAILLVLFHPKCFYSSSTSDLPLKVTHDIQVTAASLSRIYSESLPLLGDSLNRSLYLLFYFSYLLNLQQVC